MFVKNKDAIIVLSICGHRYVYTSFIRKLKSKRTEDFTLSLPKYDP